MNIWPLVVCLVFFGMPGGLAAAAYIMKYGATPVIRIFKSLLLSAPPLQHRAREDGL